MLVYAILWHAASPLWHPTHLPLILKPENLQFSSLYLVIPQNFFFFQEILLFPSLAQT